jgi:hypothetical protein
MLMREFDGEHGLSGTCHLTTRSIGCGIKVDISLSLGPRKKIAGAQTNPLSRSRQYPRVMLIVQALNVSHRIFSRDRSILDSLILEARQHWLSARSDKVDIYASEGSVWHPRTKRDI